jgi:hypothetical protein
MEKIIDTPGPTWGGSGGGSGSGSGSRSGSRSEADTTIKEESHNMDDEQKVKELQKEFEKPAGDPDEPIDMVIKIQPDICSVNINENGRIKTLQDEPGIPELMELYYDDEYDYKTGKMTGMSEPTKIQFQSDLKRFYNEFTGNDEMPDNITKFSDIKLKDYSKKSICLAKNKGVEVSYSDKLFVDYAANLKQMINAVNKKQQQLLAQINKIFVYTQSGLIKINPDLTEQSLQEVVDETRNIIIDLYLKCEADFVEGVKLYEAMVESLIFNSTKNQIESLQRASEMLYSTA